MKSQVVIGGMFMAWAALPTPGHTDQLRYWGARPDASVGWIEVGDQRYYEVTEGTEIPTWGSVKEIREDRLIVERRLSEPEKARLRESGALVHDLFEFHIPREDLRHPIAQPWRGPTQ
jgi:hypothetical protein